MVEVFWGWSSQRYVSDEEIAEIKKNMKRVPWIQKKSNEAHDKDAKKADEELVSAEKIIQEWEEKISNINKKIENSLVANTEWSRIRELIEKIKKKLRFE